MTGDRVLAERPSWVEIDLDAMLHNLSLIREAAQGAHIIAALKADGYGHGAAAVARCLSKQGIHSLATGSLDDARAVRAARIDLPILLFGGPLPETYPDLVREGFTPTVYDRAGGEAVSAAGVKDAPFYIKVDCGLGRLGVRLEEALPFIQWAATLPNAKLAGLYTHLPFADAEGMAWSQMRIEKFDELLIAVESAGVRIPVTQALASAGLLAGLRSRANAVCPGHLLYGLSPVTPSLVRAEAFRPVLAALKSQLIHVNRLGAGSLRTGVERIGVLPLGVSDGFGVIASGQEAYGLVGKNRAPILGVSLEHMTLDLSDCPDAAVGNEVVLLGPGSNGTITLTELAQWQGLRPHQVLCAFDGRLASKHFLNGAPLS